MLSLHSGSLRKSFAQSPVVSVNSIVVIEQVTSVTVGPCRLDAMCEDTGIDSVREKQKAFPADPDVGDGRFVKFDVSTQDIDALPP